MATTLPNVRKLVRPDKGYVIFDADLSGADAGVVAAEAALSGDRSLLGLFLAGKKLHASAAEDIFGDEYRNAPGDRDNKYTPKGRLYDGTKRAVHATHYGARPKTLTLTPDIGWPLARSEAFQREWNRLHPGIPEWQKRTDHELRTKRTTTNQFGYRIIWFDRIDACYTKALAWKPQSTVAHVCLHGFIKLCNTYPWVEPLLHVHDSDVFQVPVHREDMIAQLQEGLSLPIPYPEPLVLSWKLTRSHISWGDCEEIK